MKQIIVLLFLCEFSAIVIAQHPNNAIIQATEDGSRSACIDRHAGTVSLGAFSGRSNDITLSRSFFCAGDRYEIIHNGDDDATESDPDPSSQAGIGYAWYTCPPTIERSSLDDVLGDPCLLTDPEPEEGIYIWVDALSGDAAFENTVLNSGQTIPDFANGGEPVEIWFAPITIDDVDNGMAEFEGSPTGPCVHVNTNVAFSIVYLTPINSKNPKSIPDGNGGCLGSFEVEGGLPQFDENAFYSISIEHTDMPGVTGTLEGSDYGHGDVVAFSFPEDGTYRVTVEDGKSCSREFEMEVYCTDPVTFTVGSAIADIGEEVCVDIILEGFTGMGAVQFDLLWDATVFEYQSNSGFLIDADGASSIADHFSHEGRIRPLWFDGGGVTVGDGTVFFTICFEAIGGCSQSIPLEIGGHLAFSDSDNGEVTTLINQGTLTINSDGLSLMPEVCPDDGDTTGSIDLHVCGGMAPYNVVFTGPGGSAFDIIADQNGSALYDNLSSGEYIFEVTDAAGIVMTDTVDLPLGTKHTIEAMVVHPTCYDSDDGSIALDIEPPASYEIEWSNRIFNSDVIDELSNGQYGVSVTDAAGCLVTSNFTAFTSAILISGMVTDAACPGAEDGEVFASTIGGTPFPNDQYQYTFEGFPPTNAQTTSRPNLEPGDYRLEVRDANNCLATETFTVGAAAGEITIEDTIITHLTCYEGPGGFIEFSVLTDGQDSGDYLFEPDPFESPGGDPYFGTSGNTITTISGIDLPAGVYTFTVTDNTMPDCEEVLILEITQPDEITMDIELVNPAACNSASGQIIVTGNGGIDHPDADLEYIVDGQISGSGQFGGLSGGEVRVQVCQKLGGVTDLTCCAEEFFDVEEVDGIVIHGIDSILVSCGAGNDGELEVDFELPDGQDLQSITWVDQDGNSYSGNPITGLAPGTYTVTIRSSDGCLAMTTVTLSPPTDLNLVNVTYTQPSCPTTEDGAIAIEATGPGNLSYEWSHSNGSDNPVLPSVPAGTYSVTITSDVGDCSELIVDTLNLRGPDFLDVVFDQVQSALCPGQCDGSAMAVASGGTGTISYLWSSGETSQTATQLCPPESYVVISDGTCSDTFFVDIPSAQTIDVEEDLTDPSCFGDSDGSISLSVSGSNPPFTYDWSDGGPDSPDRADLPDGTYTVEINDANGCHIEHNFVLSEPGELIAEIQSQEPITCQGRDDGQATISVSGGNGGETYNWTPDVSSSATAADLAPGDYTVVVTDENGCTDDVSFSMTEPDSITFELDQSDMVLCFGEPASFTVLSAEGGSGGPYSFTINSGAPHDVGDHIDLLAGTYVVQVLDANGCFAETSIDLTQPEAFSIDITEGEIEIVLGDSAQYSFTQSSGSQPVDSFAWNAEGGTLSCTDCDMPWLSAIRNGSVMISATDADGCVATDEVPFTVDTRRKVFIPNAFSPNNDGINDIFEVYSGIGVRSINTMQIFDRWGQMLFETENLTVSAEGSGGWDGTRQGRTLNPGVYTYAVQVEFIDGEVLTYTGDVTLVQ